ncbi:MAG: hypothetical protein AAFV53_17460 [Myxococcota bacterium]
MSDPPSSPRRGHALATRLRAELDQRAAKAAEAELQRRRKDATARQRRDALMKDLEAFGRAVGHFHVRRTFWGNLQIRYQGQTLTFKPKGNDLTVRSERVSGQCAFHERLGRWVLSLDEAGSSSMVLFDRGLGLLIERSLGVRVAVE